MTSMIMQLTVTIATCMSAHLPLLQTRQWQASALESALRLTYAILY